MTWQSSKDKTDYHRQRRANVREWLNSFRTECLHCGETDPIVLDFHHRDPSKKSFPLSASNCYSYSEETILAEIAKCDILCANCHRREEHKIRNNQNYSLKQRLRYICLLGIEQANKTVD